MCFLLAAGFLVLLLAVIGLARSHNCPARHLPAAASGSWPLKVVFLHPDLGLGGAERLVVDAAVGLLRHQKVVPASVTMVTNYHNPKRAFTETVDGSLRVVVRGSWIPRHLYNKGHVLFATLRMMWAALETAVLTDPDVDVYFVDQVSATMIMLKLFAPRSKVLFYCHFPDQLCDPTRAALQRRSLAKQLYRAVFDRLEAWTMELADSIVCNSMFSRGVTLETFPRLHGRILEDQDIFYPPINVQMITREPSKAAIPEANPFENPSDDELEAMLRAAPSFVSINRYERKKNVMLAVDAFAAVVSEYWKAAASTPCPQLFIAGGYDPRLQENVDVYAELRARAESIGLAKHVTFLRSITERQKFLLLSRCRAVVYTPSGEHFGIVPVEAMAHGKIVVAVSDGGPLESVGLGDTFGLLRAPTVEGFADGMRKALHMSNCDADALGVAARERCERLFSLASFSKSLANRMLLMTKPSSAQSQQRR
jgi:alpha-1,3/alpha-1,6-mannosyltransferase